MGKIFRAHTESILITFALVLTFAIIISFIWGVGGVVNDVNGALKFTPTPAKTGFDLQSAQSLDFRGLTPQ